VKLARGLALHVALFLLTSPRTIRQRQAVDIPSCHHSVPCKQRGGGIVLHRRNGGGSEHLGELEQAGLVIALCASTRQTHPPLPPPAHATTATPRNTNERAHQDATHLPLAVFVAGDDQFRELVDFATVRLPQPLDRLHRHACPRCARAVTWASAPWSRHAQASAPAELHRMPPTMHRADYTARDTRRRLHARTQRAQGVTAAATHFGRQLNMLQVDPHVHLALRFVDVLPAGPRRPRILDHLAHLSAVGRGHAHAAVRGGCRRRRGGSAAHAASGGRLAHRPAWPCR